MTKQQLEQRLNWDESMIHKDRDTKNLKSLNETFQKPLDRLVALDLSGMEAE